MYAVRVIAVPMLRFDVLGSSVVDGYIGQRLKFPVGVAGYCEHVGKDHTWVHIGQTVDKQTLGVQSVFNDLRHR